MSAPLALSELLAGLEADGTRDHLVQLASIAGFPATSWQEGSVPRTIFELEAIPYSDLTKLVASIAGGGFLDSAERGWLDLCSAQLYNLQRKPSVYTQGTLRLTDTGGAGGFDVDAVGQLYAENGGVRYRNVGLGTLANGGTLDLTWEAEFPGSAGNLPDGTPLSLVTTLPGITVQQVTPPGGSWISQQGVDEEGDPALRVRCRARWGELGYGATDLAYKFWVLTAAAEITRVAVAEAVGDGTVSIYVAGSTGAVSGGAITAAQAFVGARRPQCVRPTVYQASTLTVAPAGVVKVRPGQLASAQAAVAAMMARYFSILPLGATIYRAPLEAAMLGSHSGILNVILTNPPEILLTASQVAVPSLASLAFET